DDGKEQRGGERDEPVRQTRIALEQVEAHRPPLPRTQLRWIIPYPVVPAKAGTQEPPRVARPWIPACAGMTVNESTCPGHALPHHVGIDDDLGPPGGLGERHGVLR